MSESHNLLLEEWSTLSATLVRSKVKHESVASAEPTARDDYERALKHAHDEPKRRFPQRRLAEVGA